MSLLPRLFAALALSLPLATAAPAQSPDPAEPSIEEMKAGIESQHPSVHYMLAMRLFESGELDEAVFWFYAGQLRYRVHLACNPDLPPDGDPALFGALSEVFGSVLNAYAFGDTDDLVATIDEVIAWDETTPNGFTPVPECAESHAIVVAGLLELRDDIVHNADDIRAQRLANGLENR